MTDFKPLEYLNNIFHMKDDNVREIDWKHTKNEYRVQTPKCVTAIEMRQVLKHFEVTAIHSNDENVVLYLEVKENAEV